MPILPLALPPQSNQGDEPHSGIAALINCYAIAGGPEQKSPMRVRAAAGLDGLVTLSGDGVRRMLEVDGKAYVVAGRVVSIVDDQGNAEVIGGLPSDGWVGIARNQRAAGVQVAICCDGLSYISTSDGPLVEITDPDLPPAIDVTTINRSFVFATADGRMIRSEIDNGFEIDGLDVAEAEAAPDGLLRVVGRGSDLIAVGTRSVEPWRDTGGEAFGFSRGDALNIGAIGPWAVTTASMTGGSVTDTVAWAATNAGGVYAGLVLMQGYNVQKISTPWIDRMLHEVSDRQSVIAMSWIERGHGMIGWRLPTTTVVYDTSTRLWHERKSRTSAGLATTWRVGAMAGLAGRVLAGDATLARLYWIDPETADEDGEEMVVTVRTPPASAFPGRLEVNHLYLDIVPGVGVISGSPADVDPMVALRLSRDNETWSASRVRPLGRQGERGRRVHWTSLGTLSQATFEFSCSAAVAREMLSASWDGATIAP